MLGALPGTEIKLGDTPVPDLNFTTDPLALQILLEGTTIPFTAMTFEVSSTVDFDIDTLLAPADDGNAAAAYYHAASLPNVSQFDSTSFELLA